VRDLCIVAFIYFITSIDTVLLIFGAIRWQRHPEPRKAKLLIFGVLLAVHPLLSLVVDAVAELPGLRLVTAFILIYFALRLAGEPTIDVRQAPLPKRSVAAIVGTAFWLDALTSVDTAVLVSAATESVWATVVGNAAAVALLVACAPLIYRWSSESSWLMIFVAAFVALSAVLQLRGEALLGRYATAEVLIPVGLSMLAFTGAYGWHQHIRRWR